MSMMRESVWAEAARQRRLGFIVSDADPGKKFTTRPMPPRSLAEIDDIFTREDRNPVILLEPKPLLVWDADGQEAKDWLAEHGIDSNTIASTPRGGTHIYQRIPEGVEGLRTRLRFLGLPLDVKVGTCM